MGLRFLACDICLVGPLVYSCYYNPTSYYCTIYSISYLKPDILKMLVTLNPILLINSIELIRASKSSRALEYTMMV